MDNEKLRSRMNNKMQEMQQRRCSWHIAGSGKIHLSGSWWQYP